MRAELTVGLGGALVGAGSLNCCWASYRAFEQSQRMRERSASSIKKET